LALWLKCNGFRADQVQAFLPTPLATASAMYHTGLNPLKRIGRDSEQVSVVRKMRQRRLHKAFLRWHDPSNWPLLREALKAMGRADLIGNGKRHLIPTFQPKSTCQQPEGRRTDPARPGARPKSTGLAAGARARSHGSRQPRTGGPRGKR